MQIRRLLTPERDVFAGDKVFDAQGRSYAFVEHSSGELVVAAGYGRPIRFKPDENGSLLIRYQSSSLRINSKLGIRMASNFNPSYRIV
jgi:hypothetical protein